MSNGLSRGGGNHSPGHEWPPGTRSAARVRWHGRLELETPLLTLAESQLALAALGSLRAGQRDAADVLRKLLRRVHPTLLPRVS